MPVKTPRKPVGPRQPTEHQTTNSPEPFLSDPTAQVENTPNVSNVPVSTRSRGSSVSSVSSKHSVARKPVGGDSCSSIDSHRESQHGSILPRVYLQKPTTANGCTPAFSYYILKYSKDLYLTTCPDQRHTNGAIGPSYYVTVTTSDGDDEIDTFEMVFEKQALAGGGQTPRPLDSTGPPPNPTRMKVSRFSGYYTLSLDEWTCRAFELPNNSCQITDGDNSWLISSVGEGFRTAACYFNDSYFVGQLKRRVPLSKRLKQTTSHLHDNEEDRDVFGWLDLFSTSDFIDSGLYGESAPVLHGLQAVVMAMTTAVSFRQRLMDKKRKKHRWAAMTTASSDSRQELSELSHAIGHKTKTKISNLLEKGRSMDSGQR